MIAVTLSAHQPWPMSASAFLFLWNMTTDYLACLAMKLLCFVFWSRGGCRGGWWGCYRDTIVWRASFREIERGGIRMRGDGREGAREWETKSLSDPTNLRDCSGADGNINHANCLMNFWWVFYKLKGYYLKMNNTVLSTPGKSSRRPHLLEQIAESLSVCPVLLKLGGCKKWYSKVVARCLVSPFRDVAQVRKVANLTFNSGENEAALL